MGLSSYSVSVTELLSALIASPDLPAIVHSLSDSDLHRLVREVGIADAGEIVALATTPQLVALFDAELFVNQAAGERETFDRRQFITWLEVLSEAGPEVVARRFTELSEDFVAFAFHQMMLVFELVDLHEQMISDVRIGRAVETTLEANLYEEIDGYLLLARAEEGWDAVLSLVLALDRDYRDTLQRVADRCVAMTHEEVDNLEDLEGVLSAAQSLAEDVEGQREDRRTRHGFVEPRAARAFLLGACQASDVSTRDPITAAYFRELSGDPSQLPDRARNPNRVLPRLRRSTASAGKQKPAPAVLAVQELQHVGSATFADRLTQMAYLANVLVAAGTIEGRRFDLAQASQAVLNTVAYGATLEARRRDPTGNTTISDVLASVAADRLFRLACTDLTNRGWFHEREFAIVHTSEELDELLDVLVD